ncbi:MAG: iron-containing alcohol dehydrogenase, partial [Clostridia bacterium]|nr:iron-containing alcohol dehydrogenase [Clostridia bacterium]
MDKLDEVRREINAVDREMAALFVRRMEAARAVAAYKKEHGLPVRDAEREKVVLAQGAAAVENEELRPYYLQFLQEEMALSRRFQERLTAGARAAADGPVVLPVRTAGGSYDVRVERGCLQNADRLLNLDRRVLVVTDEGVPPAYAARFAAQCRDPVVVTVPQGEGSKSVAVWQQLLETMLSHGFSRADCVAAVGGGVPGDLAGFAAATYMRGVDFYNVPTTVLSQVDSSVGGKT